MTRIRALTLFATVCTLFAARAALADEKEPFGRLTVAEVDKQLKDKNFYVFDNNREERWKKGHVPGAKWIVPSELTADKLPADKNATLVFYCANEKCSACHQGAETALKLGYKKVFIMPEGIAGWEKAGKPVEKG